jgi:3-hydroxyacyl-[acyl-carrier-protein] dehydratase
LKAYRESGKELLEYLPHRKPFVFVDSVELEGGRIIGERRFPPDDFFFAGHFPEYPVVPGVILVEAMAQCGGIGVRKMGIEGLGTFFLGKIKEVRFRRQVRPDELYRMEIVNLKASPTVVHQKGTGTVGGEVAVEAEWISIAGEALTSDVKRKA